MRDMPDYGPHKDIIGFVRRSFMLESALQLGIVGWNTKAKVVGNSRDFSLCADDIAQRSVIASVFLRKVRPEVLDRLADILDLLQLGWLVRLGVVILLKLVSPPSVAQALKRGVGGCNRTSYTSHGKAKVPQLAQQGVCDMTNTDPRVANVLRNIGVVRGVIRRVWDGSSRRLAVLAHFGYVLISQVLEDSEVVKAFRNKCISDCSIGNPESVLKVVLYASSSSSHRERRCVWNETVFCGKMPVLKKHVCKCECGLERNPKNEQENNPARVCVQAMQCVTVGRFPATLATMSLTRYRCCFVRKAVPPCPMQSHTSLVLNGEGCRCIHLCARQCAQKADHTQIKEASSKPPHGAFATP